MTDLFCTLARYNRWANTRLNQDLSGVSADDMCKRLPVNFGSAIGILNHLLLGDRLWLHRFTKQGQAPTSISEVPFPDLPTFAAAREAEDKRVLAFAEALSPQDLEPTLEYRNIAGKPCSGIMSLLVMQFFNHQTHHRGQVHALAGQFGIEPRDLDFVYFHQEEAANQS